MSNEANKVHYFDAYRDNDGVIIPLDSEVRYRVEVSPYLAQDWSAFSNEVFDSAESALRYIQRHGTYEGGYDYRIVRETIKREVVRW